MKRYTIKDVNVGSDERPEMTRQLLVWEERITLRYGIDGSYDHVLDAFEGDDDETLERAMHEAGHGDASWSDTGP